MASKVIMPKLGMAMKDGVVAQWLKQDGDGVAKDEPVVVVMSKKITYKVPAPATGVLRVVARVKETRPVGATIAFVTEPGEPNPEVEAVAPTPAAEAVPVVAPSPAAAAPAPAPTGFVLASPAARRLARERGVDLALVTGTGQGGMVVEADVQRFLVEREKEAVPGEILATSAAKRLAAEHRVNLAEVRGSGISGRITEDDVRAFLERAVKAPPAATATAPAAGVIPFTGMRQAIAEQMVESLRTMAQVTLTMEVDATELVRLREQLKAEFDLTYTDLLVKAVAKTLKRHPLLNATLVGEEIHLLEAIHIGVAVALPDGLIVPVIRDADKRTVQEIAQEARRLVQGAREGRLSVDEVTGGTFTITNLGGYGVDGFTPIINPPEVAILGVGRIAEKPVIYEGQFAKRSLLVLSLTIDHRIVDGAPGAEFLRALKEMLENPYRLLV